MARKPSERAGHDAQEDAREQPGRDLEAAAELPNLSEVTRLLEDFAGELLKLDESLKTLSAFLTRIQICVEPRPPRELH